MVKKIKHEHGLEIEPGKDYIIGPPKEIFRDGLTVQERMVEGDIIPILETDENNNPLMEVREGQGLFTLIRGHKYPLKGYYWTDKQGGPLFALGQIKKYLICQLRLFSKFKLVMVGVLLLGRKRFINAFIKELNRFSEPLLQPYILKEEMYCTIARESERLVGNFLTNLGFEEVAPLFAFTIKNIVQFDDSYRLMLGDTFAEVNEEALFNNPEKELLRLVNIMLERRSEHERAFEKFSENLGAVKKLLYVLKIKYVRDSLLSALQVADLENLKIDEIDKYHTLYKGGHMYGGKTDHERLLEWVKLYDGKIPEMSRVSLQNE